MRSNPLGANRSVNTDAQSRLAAAPRRALVAGYVRRYMARVCTVSAAANIEGAAVDVQWPSPSHAFPPFRTSLCMESA